MRSLHRGSRRVLGWAGLAAALAAVAAAPAVAAPELDITLTRDAVTLESVHRSDERTDYRVDVQNTATGDVVAGDTLTCNPTISGGSSPTHSYQWRRNGQLIGGETGQAYTTSAPADEGAVIQCQLTAVNTVPDVNGGGFAGMTGASPVTFVVDPQPTAIPPAPPSPLLALPTPANPVAGTIVTCNPGTWTGVTEPFQYQWYVNGVVRAGATASTYAVQASDVPGAIQCAVTGSNGETAVTAISNRRRTSPAPNPAEPAGVSPTVASPDTTAGMVTAQVELPPGSFADRFRNPNNGIFGPNPNGWSCASVPASGGVPAKAVCTRSDGLGAGASYPPFAFTLALGADVPSPATVGATVSGGGGGASGVDADEFEIGPAKLFDLKNLQTLVADSSGDRYRQAGGHPFSAGASFSFERYMPLRPVAELQPFLPIGALKTVLTDVPPGFVGNPLAPPLLCPTTEEMIAAECPPSSVVGGIDLTFAGGIAEKNTPIYAMEPEFGRPAQFSFTSPLTDGVYVLYPKLRPEDDYAITLESAPAPARTPSLLDVDAELCGFGSITSKAANDLVFEGCKEADDPTSFGKPFITTPPRCRQGEPPTTKVLVDSWQQPNVFRSKTAEDPTLTGCHMVGFEPDMRLNPSSHEADSSSGIVAEIFVPPEGLESKALISQAHLKRVTVTMPPGMSVNASAGHGLSACTSGQIGIDPVSGTPNDQEVRCPDSSKIGSVEVVTPLLALPLPGSVYIAKQGADNPFDSTLALYLVVDSKQYGITVKLAGEVKADPVTGQMTVVFNDNPEVPFSHVRVSFPQGPRSPLQMPRRCGTYEIKSEMTSWSADDPENPTPAETVTQISRFDITSGPGGGPCPTDSLDPKLRAGTDNPIAGMTSPFRMSLRRDDGTQRFTGLEVSPPQGLTAYLKGVDYCPDQALSSISPDAETGQAQIDNPSCPASSQVGTASAGAGAGANPLYVNTGKVYLAGPYRGAPISLAVVTPAVAGPLDLGNVVIRTALYVNRKTAQITAVSDPVPTILHGILLDIRDIRVSIDRPSFTLNPTNCEPMEIAAKVTGDSGGTANVSNRFQVADCAALGFKPRMSLTLRGGTKRGDNPALRAVVRPREGHANIGRASVTLPRSAFLDQAHIRTICTRVQFAADKCPKAAIYGRAEAITPLLDNPLKGPVYLRSSDNKLPDLVADLRGPANQPIMVEAAFRTDSIKGGIRSTLDFAPDAPVTKFTLQMQGGKKGLVVNSRDICKTTNLATAKLVGQNGRRYTFRPKVVATNCGKQRKGKRSQTSGG